MSFNPLLAPADLAALLSSRLCHDLISPIAAANNAIELYDDEMMQKDAMDLLKLSAQTASIRLQFFRMAYGAMGGISRQDSDTIPIEDARIVAHHYMIHEKFQLLWHSTTQTLPKHTIKFILNMLLVAQASLPRGGTIKVEIEPKKQPHFLFTCQGSLLRIPVKFIELHEGTMATQAIDAHTIQFYYTLLLARVNKLNISFAPSKDEIIFTANKID